MWVQRDRLGSSHRCFGETAAGGLGCGLNSRNGEKLLDLVYVFSKETMALANGLDVRKEGMKRMMSRCLVPFLVKW